MVWVRCEPLFVRYELRDGGVTFAGLITHEIDIPIGSYQTR